MSAVHDYDFAAFDQDRAPRQAARRVQMRETASHEDMGFEERSQLAELGSLLGSITASGVRSLASAAGAGASVAGAGVGAGLLAFGMLVARRPLESMIVALFATGTVVAANNMLAQPRLHPAPMLVNTEQAVAWHMRQGTYTITLPKAASFADAERAAIHAATQAIAKTQTVREMQMQLQQRNVYNGPINGIYSPKMAKAIRTFELQVGLPETGEMSQRLLDALRSSASEDAPVVISAIGKPASAAMVPALAEPAPAAPVSLLTVQKRLAELGYGPLSLTGKMDTDTRRAIEHYQDDRLLSRTGEVNERFIADLALVTGKPL